MTAISTTISSGAYDVTYDGNSIGLTEGPIRLQQNLNAIPIRGTQWGDTIIEYITRGMSAFGVLVIKEWTQTTKSLLWPFGTTLGICDEPGLKFSGYCKALVLTAQANTPAATAGPVTRSYPNVAVLPGHTLDMPLWAGPRDIVVALGFLPEVYSGRKARYFTDT